MGYMLSTSTIARSRPVAIFSEGNKTAPLANHDHQPLNRNAIMLIFIFSASLRNLLTASLRVSIRVLPPQIVVFGRHLSEGAIPFRGLFGGQVVVELKKPSKVAILLELSSKRSTLGLLSPGKILTKRSVSSARAVNVMHNKRTSIFRSTSKSLFWPNSPLAALSTLALCLVSR